RFFRAAAAPRRGASGGCVGGARGGPPRPPPPPPPPPPPALLAWAGSYWPVSLYIIALSIITIVATLIAPETARNSLRS
ncbi:hypothetical protein ABID59_006683, partial [Bradyrhizobium sp. S3.3.6]